MEPEYTVKELPANHASRGEGYAFGVFCGRDLVVIAKEPWQAERAIRVLTGTASPVAREAAA